MLKVTHKDVLLSIGFKHDVDEDLGRRRTTCYIQKIEDKENKKGPEIGHGVSMCHEGDSFCKAVGRKFALARALKSAGLDRDTRTSVWDTYFHYTNSIVSK